MKYAEIISVTCLAVITVAALVFFQKHKPIDSVQTTKASNILQSDIVGRVNSTASTGSGEKAPALIEADSLAACGSFLSAASSANLNKTVETILQQSTEKEILELTEYQLLTSDQREMIVQLTPDEEPKNKIRVLRVAEDGFPDRIKNFPNAKGSPEDQLQGAISLGTLQNKIEKYSVNQGNGIQLKFEKSQNQVLRINYSNGRNQLLCEEAKCSCQSF